MNDTYIPERAMLIYAHPDDIEFTVAGTAARWVKEGSDVYYVVITDGNVGSHDEGMTADRLIETRRSEQRAAAKVIGAKECIFSWISRRFTAADSRVEEGTRSTYQTHKARRCRLWGSNQFLSKRKLD